MKQKRNSAKNKRESARHQDLIIERIYEPDEDATRRAIDLLLSPDKKSEPPKS